MTKEELEQRKLQLEIEKLKLPFWKNPAYLTILVTIIVGFSSYYIATDKEKKHQIDDLTKKNDILEKQQNELERTKVELTADHFQRMSEDLKYKNEEIEKNIQLKELKLITLENNFTAAKKDFANFQVKLNQQEKEYNRTKAEYENYKQRVKSVIDEVATYGPGYANGLIRSPAGQEQINYIISLSDKNLMKTEIGRFAFGISNQAFDQSLAKKTINLDIQ
jgi:hypothetical protein